jgi:hypothetical protein
MNNDNNGAAEPDVRIGTLPLLDGPAVRTPLFDFGRDQADFGVALGGIVTFDGPSGTGKTTTTTVAATESRIRFVYTKLRHGARTKETAEALFTALHPHESLGRRKERELISDCADALMPGNVGVIADEVHRIGLPGMLLLCSVWDSVKNETGRGFPLFLVGCKVHSAIATVEELDTRVLTRANFHPLPTEDVLPVVQAMSDRCAATPVGRLEQVDKLWARGNLRKWRTFISLTSLDATKAEDPVTVEEIRAFLLRQGQTLKNGKVT